MNHSQLCYLALLIICLPGIISEIVNILYGQVTVSHAQTHAHEQPTACQLVRLKAHHLQLTWEFGYIKMCSNNLRLSAVCAIQWFDKKSRHTFFIKKRTSVLCLVWFSVTLDTIWEWQQFKFCSEVLSDVWYWLGGYTADYTAYLGCFIIPVIASIDCKAFYIWKETR